MNYRKVFSATAVDRIVAKVDMASTHRRVAVDLDRKQLRRDLDRAVWWYRNFKDLSPAQWSTRLHDCDNGIKSAQALLDWCNSPAGKWWLDQMPLAIVRPRQSAVLDPVMGAKNLIRNLRRQRDLIVPELSGARGRAPASRTLGRSSVLAWWVGEHLADVFERIFSRKAAPHLSETTDVNGLTVLGKVSAYIAFVLAVIDETPADIERATAATIDRHRKTVMRRAKKKDPRH